MSGSSSRVVRWVRSTARRRRRQYRRIASESWTAAVLDALASSFRDAPIQVLSLGGMAAVVGNTAVLVFGRRDEITVSAMVWRLILFLLTWLGRHSEVSWRELTRTSRLARAFMR